MTDKEVINFLNQVRKILLDDKSWLESTIQPINEAFDMAIDALTAQPETHEERTETHACDLIDRQALMKEFSDFVRASNNSDFAPTPTWNDAVSLVGSMPSAQPSSSCAHENDTISRQAAIDNLQGKDPSQIWDTADIEVWVNALPSAQPASYRQVTGKLDCISRQAAIDSMANTLWHYPNECYRNLNEYEFAKGLAELGLKSVPPAQPEIIHCRECKYHIDGFFCQVANHHTSDKDCCASVFGAERRKDG